ncbi:MAG: deoxyhypusine synthase family protein [Planctomycetes bacterium]|nr:deoxyhypusine synthase family protein [Planctomycetota bacterium]
MQKSNGTIREFIETNFRHFNAAVVVDAAKGWIDLLESGGKMFVTLAGAMSTGELGITLAEMIRKDKVHGICCTGANLEEDIFNLVAHEHYLRVPHYRDLSKQDELAIADKGLARVTDTCIPEEQAMDVLRKHIGEVWKRAQEKGERYFPFEYVYQILESGVLEKSYQIDPRNSWVLAAREKNLKIFTPGWEDSTIGNWLVAQHKKGMIRDVNLVRSGLEQMAALVDWYRETSAKNPIGFFQIGGGIAGDFPICVVPLIRIDLEDAVPHWKYFCQISDSTTSYGGYSGAVPNEKITWDKVSADTPTFVIESDATIVAPLIFAYVLGY